MNVYNALRYVTTTVETTNLVSLTVCSESEKNDWFAGTSKAVEIIEQMF